GHDPVLGSGEAGHSLAYERSAHPARLSNTMKFTALALITLMFAAVPAAAKQKETERVDRTIAFAGGGTLKLNNFSGDVRVTGTSGTDVVIHAVRTATRDRLENIKLDIAIEGSTIVIDANHKSRDWRDRDNNVVETKFDIQVPSSTRPDLHAFSGNLIVTETIGEIAAQTFSGNIDLDVSRAQFTPDLKAETFSGDIKTHLNPGGSGRVEFTTFSGDLQSDLPLVLHSGS